MAKIFSIILCINLILSPFLYSQEEGEDDFLDKVNEEKPKKAIKTKKAKIQKFKKRKKKSSLKNRPASNPKKNPEIVSSNTNLAITNENSNESGWINEEMEITPKQIKGINDPKVGNSVPEQKDKNIFEFVSKSEDKKNSPVQISEKPIETKSILENVFGSFSDYKKVLIIIGLIIIFALYRIRAGRNRMNNISHTRGSPRTISNFRKK